MANFLGNFVSLMSVPVFYFQNLVTQLMKHAVEIGSCGMIYSYIPSFMNIGLGIQNVITSII
jgi:hypothetical protein